MSKRISKKQLIVDNTALQDSNALLASTVNRQNATIQMLESDIRGHLARIQQMNSTIIDLEQQLRTVNESTDDVSDEWNYRTSGNESGRSE